VVDADRKVIGIFTDGDLRRLLTAGTDVRPLRAADLMHPNPRSIRPDALAADAARLMEDYRISSLPVTNPDGTLAGALNTHDLMRAKVI
ncbi:MAG: CBS domain-containing protein, partial [Ramlibacter sp.]|nr:CBS domain-containing protein [Ramlibacter sp.]